MCKGEPGCTQCIGLTNVPELCDLLQICTQHIKPPIPEEWEMNEKVHPLLLQVWPWRAPLSSKPFLPSVLFSIVLAPAKFRFIFKLIVALRYRFLWAFICLLPSTFLEIGADLERSVEQLFPMFWLAHVSSPSPALEHAPINRTKTMASSLKWPPTAGVWKGRVVCLFIFSCQGWTA